MTSPWLLAFVFLVMILICSWYVFNVSIIYEVFMLLYSHSWMFHNNFIATLYHFLGLTYWPSAQCQLLFFACFLHHRKSISNGVQTPWNFLWIFMDQKTTNGPVQHLGVPRGGHNPPGRAWAPRRAQVGCSHLRGLPHPLFPYKSSNIPKPFGVALD